MKNIANSKLKNSFKLKLNNQILKFPHRSIRSLAGISEPKNGIIEKRKDIVNNKLKFSKM